MKKSNVILFTYEEQIRTFTKRYSYEIEEVVYHQYTSDEEKVWLAHKNEKGITTSYRVSKSPNSVFYNQDTEVFTIWDEHDTEELRTTFANFINNFYAMKIMYLEQDLEKAKENHELAKRVFKNELGK